MYQIFHEDCLEGMKRIPDGSVDMILTDPPFAITALPYDKKLDFAEMWTQIKRVLKPYTAAVLFASGKFTHELIASNFEQFKYKWIWRKNAPTLFVQSKNRPMSCYEEICVFSDGVVNHASLSKRRMKYNPQGLVASTPLVKEPQDRTNSQLRSHSKWYQEHATWKFGSTVGARPSHQEFYVQDKTNYPCDILEFKVPSAAKKLHPNQKPVDLLEYLIRNEGETVLDATMGSGSTGVAAINTGRNFIGFETEEKFFNIAQERISKALADKESALF